jgi:hypothetical protein
MVGKKADWKAHQLVLKQEMLTVYLMVGMME